MNIEYLNEYERKLKNCEYEIMKLEKQLRLEEGRTTADSVTGSSKQFPYIKRNIAITGRNTKRINQIKKRMKIFKNSKNKLNKELEYKIKNLEDRQMADILERRYIKKQEWKQIAIELNYADESGVRKYFCRYLKKN